MLLVDLLVALLVPSVICVLLVRDMWRVLQPTRLMFRGEFAASRAASADLAQSWMRRLVGMRATAPYMIAAAHHMEGDLEETAKILDELRRGDHGPLDADMTFAMQSLEAANLVLQQSEPERVLRLLAETGKVRRVASDELMEAIALLALDRRDEAEARFLVAGDEPTKPKAKLGRIVLRWDEKLEETTYFTLRGMYLRQTGRETEAVEALLRASARDEGSKTNVYVEGARRLLADTRLAAPEISA